MLRMFWPMKAANDESLRHSNKQKTIYDEVGGMPEYSYDMEMVKYNELRWRKGLVQNVVPAMAYGTVLGFLYGLSESRRGLVRHASRPRIIFGNMLTACGMGMLCSGTHQALLMVCDYKAAVWQPVLAGCIGGASYSAICDGLSIARGATGGVVVGLIYTMIVVGAQKYQERSLTAFCVTQQQQNTPITKVAPEVQRLYRAWLYDHRPIEDLDGAKRQALVLDRDQKDTRLDGTAMMEAMSMKAVDWVPEFPEWWPLKFQPKSEKGAIVEKRLRDDAFERRKLALLENQVMFSHPMRTESGRSTSDGHLDMPSDRS